MEEFDFDIEQLFCSPQVHDVRQAFDIGHRVAEHCLKQEPDCPTAVLADLVKRNEQVADFRSRLLIGLFLSAAGNHLAQRGFVDIGPILENRLREITA